MSLDIIRARAFADVETAIATASRDLTAALPNCTPFEQRCLTIAAEHARTVVTELGKHPLELVIAWPAGVPKDVRATLTAQLHSELERAAFLRLRAEFAAMFAMVPAVAKTMAEWIASVAAQEGAGAA